ncbi:Uncharacterized protein dnl_05250 [Desulfonema limicola]|uniref:NitT/TauT family transport system substrate-binding protein n=1 Tax=Desulfonema limicola TaxID=45656 RepID=A0A975B3V0_9BACT|nr:ABC transporter substrate-binding protein [Desulfonema limicola]QTA78304.1 Uncharacterized protein dnl_05250 [Desulfonema limicola]
MQFKNIIPGKFYLSLPWRIFGGAAGWLVLISCLHYYLNYEHGSHRIIRMGYMPVITNLAAPLLDYATKNSEHIRFKAIKFASFAEIGEALRNDDIQAAFIIAPLAIVLRQQGEDVKIVYIGNRHESTLVAGKDLNIKTLKDLAGKTIAVPMRYSGHNLSILRLLEKTYFKDRVRIVEMNPPDMASALTSGSLDAYCVGEPFAAQTLKSKDASLVHYVEDVWPGFICNLMIVKQSFMEKEPDILQIMVQGAVRSGLWAEKNIQQASEIASQYWNQPFDLVQYALTNPGKRICFDRFIPRYREIQEIADLMKHFGLSKTSDINGLIESRFAEQADLENIFSIETIIKSNN